MFTVVPSFALYPFGCRVVVRFHFISCFAALVIMAGRQDRKMFVQRLVRLERLAEVHAEPVIKLQLEVHRQRSMLTILVGC